MDGTRLVYWYECPKHVGIIAWPLWSRLWCSWCIVVYLWKMIKMYYYYHRRKYCHKTASSPYFFSRNLLFLSHPPLPFSPPIPTRSHFIKSRDCSQSTLSIYHRHTMTNTFICITIVTTTIIITTISKTVIMFTMIT